MHATKLDYYQLELQPGHSQLTLKSVAWQRYLGLIESAAPGAALAARVWTGRNGVAIHLNDLNGFPLTSFLEHMHQTWFIDDALDECWALDSHSDEGSRTPTGKLVYEAKTYRGKPGNLAMAGELADLLAARALRDPRLKDAHTVVSVPANPPKRPFDLPEVLGNRVADSLGVPFDRELLVKIHPTREIKHLSPSERSQCVDGAYAVTRPCNGEAIIVVDDIVQTGTTLQAVGNELRRAGADRLIGLAATWAARGLGW